MIAEMEKKNKKMGPTRAAFGPGQKKTLKLCY